MTPTSSRKLRILVADDEAINRLLLQKLLQKQGHEVLQASNGQEAVEVFAREAPDTVLMDVMMPVMDGYEATRQIKQLAGERLVPVIFVTALSDSDALYKCIECGGNDFLSKPFNHVVLQAKIKALQDLSDLYETVRVQRNQLAEHTQHLQREQEVAQQVFARVIANKVLESPNIHYLLSPQAVFNGDLLLAAHRPSGELNLMLGDFTGHGLPAAIGSIPVSDIFYGMTAKGFAISEIVSEINRKVSAILPPGLFLAACLLELNAENNILTVWNGGIPDLLIYAAPGEIRQHISSHHFPFGVVNNERLDTSLEMAPIQPGDRIFLYTDGVVELQNRSGDFYGTQRLEQCFQHNQKPEQIFQEICDELAGFLDGDQQNDDITLIEVIVPEKDELKQSNTVPAQRTRDAMPWKAGLELGHAALRSFDPLPHLAQIPMEIQQLQSHKQNIYVILAELFSNALEHGLLGLDSKLKSCPSGFGQYYLEREQKLAQLEHGWIRFSLEHEPSKEGGCLRIRIEDSGPGFDFTRGNMALDENNAFHGRGIPLVKSLCQSMTYFPPGNCVEAIYLWDMQGDSSTQA